MLGKVVGELRRAGPKKIAIFTIVAVIAVIFAYGDNSTDDASGRTLPKVMLVSGPHQLTSGISAARPQR